MLVLSRRLGETIAIGDDVVLQISRISGQRVGISIDAPRDVIIRRGELKDDCSRSVTTLDYSDGPSLKVCRLTSVDPMSDVQPATE